MNADYAPSPVAAHWPELGPDFDDPSRWIVVCSCGTWESSWFASPVEAIERWAFHADDGSIPPLEPRGAPVDVTLTEPTPTDLVHQLHTALYGTTRARPESPAQVWRSLLDEVRRLATRAAPLEPGGEIVNRGFCSACDMLRVIGLWCPGTFEGEPCNSTWFDLPDREECPKCGETLDYLRVDDEPVCEDCFANGVRPHVRVPLGGER